MGDIGGPELIIVLVVVLLVFGGSKLPELARSLGKAKSEFHRGLDEGSAGKAGPAPTPAEPAAAPAPVATPPAELVAPPEDTEGPTV